MLGRIFALWTLGCLASAAQTARPADNKDAGSKPQRTVSGASPVSTGKAAQTASDERGGRDHAKALDSLSASTDDLNAIRDENLRRLTSDGCPPEVSARIAEVKGRLAAAQAELKGVEPAAAPEKKPAPAAPGSALALASDWFKAGDPAPADTAARSNDQRDAVGSVLPGGPARTAAPGMKAPLTAERRRTLEQDVTALESELAHLVVACPGGKK